MWDLKIPERAFAEALHGFGWLDDLVSSHIKLGDVNDAFKQLETGEIARNVIVFD